MLLRLFRSFQPVIIILIPLMGILIWMQSFSGVPQRVFFFDIQQQPLFALFYNLLENQSFLSSLTTFVFVLIGGFLLVRLNTIYIFIPDRTYMPALFFLLIAGSYIPLQRLNPSVFGVIFLLLALDKIFQGYRREGLIYNSFEAAFLIAIGSMFYTGLFFLLPLVWIGLAFFRPGYWKEWFFSIIGFVLPYLFLFSWYYLTGKSITGYLESLANIFTSDADNTAIRFHYAAFYTYTGILVLLSSAHIVGVLPLKKILARRSYIIFFWNFALGTVSFLLLPALSYEMLPLIAVPVSLLLSHYFMETRSKLAGEILLIFFFLLVILIQVMELRLR